MEDHYAVLGVSKQASKAEIKESFRKLAVKFHPDKHSQSSDVVKKNAIHRFKQVSEAYDVLMDDRKRALYNLRTAASSGRAGGFGYYYSTKNHGTTPRYSYNATSSSSSSGGGFEFETVLRFVTRRSFLLNVAFASALLGGAVVIQRCGETLWKMQNSGKSFEEAMESIEKIKTQQEKR